MQKPCTEVASFYRTLPERDKAWEVQMYNAYTQGACIQYAQQQLTL